MDGQRKDYACAGCRQREREIEARQREIEALRGRLGQWERKLEALQRSASRQAAPFRRRWHVEQPKKPGRPKGHSAARAASA